MTLYDVSHKVLIHNELGSVSSHIVARSRNVYTSSATLTTRYHFTRRQRFKVTGGKKRT